MKRTTLFFGLAALGFGLLYDLTQILDVAGVFPVPWGLFAIVLPSLFLAWSYAALVSVLHAGADEATRRWTQLALTFATMYAGLNTLVYPVQLAVIVPQELAGGEGLASVFAMTSGRPLTAVNAAAYALLSLSCLLLSFAYARRTRGGLARVALVAHGALAPVIPTILFVPQLLPVGALWIVTFPLAMIGVLRAERSIAA